MKTRALLTAACLVQALLLLRMYLGSSALHREGLSGLGAHAAGCFGLTLIALVYSWRERRRGQ